VSVPTYRDQPAVIAADLRGVGLDGSPLSHEVLGTGRWTLLFFLSSGCQGCLEIWDALHRRNAGGMATDEDVVAVTRGMNTENVDELGLLAPEGVPVLMSDEAWSSYRVEGPPFFVLVDGSSDRVVTEGVAWGVSQVAGHVRRAREGTGGPEVPRLVPPSEHRE